MRREHNVTVGRGMRREHNVTVGRGMRREHKKIETPSGGLEPPTTRLRALRSTD